MATSEFAVSSILDIPGRMAQFAAARGWSTAMDGNTARITRPLELTEGRPDFDLKAADIVSFTVEPVRIDGVQSTSSNARVNARQGLTITPSGRSEFLSTDRVLMFSPALNGRFNLPDIPNPTKLHCFGEGLPRPFLAFVIEYGFNQYRHVYLGTLDRVGSYRGGDCASVTNTRATQGSVTGSGLNAWTGAATLFRATHEGAHDYTTTLQSAGVHVGDGMDGEAWRRFNRGSSIVGFYDSVTTKMSFGGWGDGFDDLLMSHGFADYSGEQLLFPIQLYSVLLGGAATRFRPLGSPRGVRNVNMQNLEPGQLISQGGRDWRVFPALRKSLDEVIPYGPAIGSGVGGDFAGQAWRAFESSLYAGHAYPVTGA